MIDLVGKRFGRLLVAAREGALTGEAAWACDCDCGSRVVVRGYSLRKGHTQSCGCLQRERTAVAKQTHGLRRTREYKIWSAMKYRCQSASSPAYKDYGGRGVAVCDRWGDFAAFYADMGVAPENCSIERIDNALGYEPSNCRWASAAEQARNKRNNIVIEHDGVSMCLSDWALTIGVSRGCLRGRMRRGWTGAALLDANGSRLG